MDSGDWKRIEGELYREKKKDEKIQYSRCYVEDSTSCGKMDLVEYTN